MSKRSAIDRSWVRGAQLFGIGVIVGLSSCSQASDATSIDQPHWQTTFSDLKLKPAVPAQEYFEIRQDYRKCVSPLCGGYFAKAVNRPWTRCADGSRARECYVAELSTKVELPTADGIVVRGQITSKEYPEFGDLGQLVVAEAWGSATNGEVTGAFFRVSNSGIVCVTTPCPTVDLARLNTNLGHRVSGLDLESVGANEEQLTAAQAAYEAGTLVVSGRVRTLDRATGKVLVASQFYLPASARGCEADTDCEKGLWCRQTEAGSNECVPFVEEGESCGGFTLPWYFEQCLPGLVCDTPVYVADAPGVCRPACTDNSECPEEGYCNPSGVCRSDGTCDVATDCVADGNTWSHISCVGYPTCPLFGDGDGCGWSCGAPQCVDLLGSDFGPCDAVLGYGMYFGQCTAVSGCDAQSTPLFSTLEECQLQCEG
jgi:hypothetical protein